MLKKTLSAVLFVVFAAAASSAQEQPPPTPTPTPQATPAATPPPPKPDPRPKDPAAAAEQKKKYEEAKRKYEALLDKAKKGEGAIDYKALRFAFFETPDFNPLTGMMDYRAVWGALGSGDNDAALKATEAVLAKNYVDINAHMVAHIAHREKGNADKSKYHRAWADGLLDSVKSPGDGKSIDKAFEVISISEEYALFQALGVRRLQQSLMRDKGHAYDAVVVVDPKTNQQTTYYFNVDKPFSAYGRD